MGSKTVYLQPIIQELIEALGGDLSNLKNAIYTQASNNVKFHDDNTYNENCYNTCYTNSGIMKINPVSTGSINIKFKFKPTVSGFTNKNGIKDLTANTTTYLDKETISYQVNTEYQFDYNINVIKDHKYVLGTDHNSSSNKIDIYDITLSYDEVKLEDLVSEMIDIPYTPINI